ncbi:hypothetical protein M514_07325 [Trichuris suis]|uniref:Uncharacterized protein n=1 Tax=Trichuris suis TaxID=68888 RepID=A0A085M3K2_9BILA|nr:hypothetical protein M513_07325 [Trichuris suis]KFD68340.1 hypothetical protein M514_07325 [Trichuris suis]
MSIDGFLAKKRDKSSRKAINCFAERDASHMDADFVLWPFVAVLNFFPSSQLFRVGRNWTIDEGKDKLHFLAPSTGGRLFKSFDCSTEQYPPLARTIFGRCPNADKKKRNLPSASPYCAEFSVAFGWSLGRRVATSVKAIGWLKDSNVAALQVNSGKGVILLFFSLDSSKDAAFWSPNSTCKKQNWSALNFCSFLHSNALLL